jgi:hypothetical protein
MFIIHGVAGDHYIPLIFFFYFPANKRQVMLWSYINYPIEESQKIGKVLAPTTVVADFEEAIHQSVTDTWANVYVSLDVDLIWVNHGKLFILFSIECKLTEYNILTYILGGAKYNIMTLQPHIKTRTPKSGNF